MEFLKTTDSRLYKTLSISSKLIQQQCSTEH